MIAACAPRSPPSPCAAAAILGAALEGINISTPLPQEVVGDPAAQSDEEKAATNTVLLPSDLASVLDTFEKSDVAQLILGPEIVAGVLAVRRWELDHHGDTDPDDLPAKFRFAWSI